MTLLRPEWRGMTCKCGRKLDKMHCASCGSTNLQGLAKVAVHVVEDDNGVPVERYFKSYRCRKCAQIADEYMTATACCAPELETLSIRAKRLVDSAEAIVARETPLEKRRRIAQAAQAAVDDIERQRQAAYTVTKPQESEVITRDLSDPNPTYVDPMFGNNGKPKEDTK
jgi:hypothetical protein